MVTALSARQLYIYLEARAGGDEDSAVYTDFITFAEEVFQIHGEEPTYCGTMIMTIENDYTFVTIDELTETVYLRPTFDSPNGRHDQARIRFQMSRALTTLNFAVTIEATIDLCVVQLLGLKIQQYATTYFIGDTGFAYGLPDVLQDPPCGIPISQYNMVAEDTILTPD